MTELTRRELLGGFAATVAAGAASEAHAQNRMLSPRDIRGPAIVYVTYAGCGTNIHNFNHIAQVAQRAGVPVYAITLNPDIDRFTEPHVLSYSTVQNGQIRSHRVAGQHIYPISNQEAVSIARGFGLSVNPANLFSHSNRLVFIDRNKRPVANIPSTQPVDRIVAAAPWAFQRRFSLGNGRG